MSINPNPDFTAEVVERTVRVRWPDNDRQGATPPPDGWQEHAWASQPTLHEIDEGSITGCSVLRWRDDPRPDTELLAVSLALVTGRPASSAVSVVPPATNQTALRDRIAEALVSWTYRGKEPDPGVGMLETVRANAYGRADAVLAVLPAPVDRTAELAALVRDFLDPDRCQLDHHGYCQAHSWMCGGSRCPHARAREVLAEIDSEQPAVGSCVAAEAPHTATPADEPWLTDSARIGRALIWSWSDVGKGAFREGYRAAQAEARALLGGERGAETATGARIVAHVLATHTDLHCLNCAPPPLGDIWTPVTADELDDGGVCARCGADVLIPQAPQ